MSKQTGLAAFTSKKNPSAEQAADVAIPRERSRGKGQVVALTVRLSRSDWERLHQLAVAEGVSIQQLAIQGFSKVFQEKGLPTL